MSNKKLLPLIIFVLLFICKFIKAEDKKILIFDPIYHNYQHFHETLQSVIQDSITIIHVLDSSILNYYGMFMFLSDGNNEHIIDSTESELLINYLQDGKNLYLYSYIQDQDIYNIPFWNYIGIHDWNALLTATYIDTIVGVENTFTEGIAIQESWFHHELPYIGDSCYVILDGISSSSFGFPIAYAHEPDSSLVVIDLFNTVNKKVFLERLLIHFDLIQPSTIVIKKYVEDKEYKLLQNYPNPFNSRTKIEYYLPESDQIEITMYNVRGHTIRVLYKGVQTRGSHSLEIDGNYLPSGVYYYSIETAVFKKTFKCVLLK